LLIEVVWSGLTGGTTASHIHAATLNPGTGTAGVATTQPYFAGFPIGVTSGSYTNLLDLTLSSSYNSSFITANGGTTASAEIALTSAIANDRAYLNIHSQTFGGGEIRGFLLPVPEPSSVALFGVGGLLLVKRCRSRRTQRS
jgi:CHRD domain/PEP-CTERM motif